MTEYNYSVVSKKLFDINHSNPNAKIAIVGISPRPAQTKESIGYGEYISLVSLEEYSALKMNCSLILKISVA